MPYLGQSPKETFSAATSQVITGTGATNYTLNTAVSSPEDLEVFINNVQQQPTTTYTVSGSTISFDDALNSTDTCYVIFRGSTKESRVHPAGSSLTAANITASGNATVTGNLTTSGSASVTGDLTVDTSTFKVDSANNRIGIGTASPQYVLQVNGGTDIMQLKGTGGNAFLRLTDENSSADFSIGADDGSSSGAGSFIVYDRANSAYRLFINSSGETIPTLFKPDKYVPILGPQTVTGGFVNGASTSTWHTITNMDINNIAGGYASGNVGIQGEIYWTHGTVAYGYNTTIRFTLPPNSSNTHSSYSSGNFSSFSFAGNVYSEIPCIVTYHTSMTSNHDIRLRLRNPGNSYDPLRLQIYASTSPNSGGAKITLWRG